MPHQQAAIEFNRSVRPGLALPLGTAAGFMIVIAALLAIAFYTYRTLEIRSAAADRGAVSLQTLEALDTVMSTLKDAETGQRGFLLTGNENYLVHYERAIRELPADFMALTKATSVSPQFRDRLDQMERLSKAKMEELGQVIALKRAGNADAAIALVRSDRGKVLMDGLRVIAAQIFAEERAEALSRQTLFRGSARGSYVVLVLGSAVLLLFVFAAGVMASRAHRARQTQNWLRAGQMALSEQLQGDDRLRRTRGQGAGLADPFVAGAGWRGLRARSGAPAQVRGSRRRPWHGRVDAW
jgi:CHASE3 domain sensor protein